MQYNYVFTNSNSETFTDRFSFHEICVAWANNSALYPSSPVHDNGLLQSNASANELISSIYASLYLSKKKYLGLSNTEVSFVEICTFDLYSLPAVTTPPLPKTSIR